MNKTLLCTGFHRSATSATANYLQNAGLNMGYELMGGNISNPNGHYEDWPVVHLHDSQLAKNHTNWQYHDNSSLRSETNFLNEYITRRNQHDRHWGVKDPRACLFLEDWHQNLGNQGYYLFIARHWSSCIESLLHRHSREFAHQLPVLNLEHITFQFWINPALAARMWIAYNRRLIEFTQKYPERCLIFTQRALFNRAPVIARVNEKFGFELNTETQSPFRPELFNDKASKNIRQSLSTGVISELDHLWRQLLSLADTKNSDESPIEYTPPPVPKSFLAGYQEALSQQCNKSSVAISNQQSEKQHKALYYPVQPSADAISEWLNRLPLSIVNTANIEQIEHYVDEHQPTNGNMWIELGKLCMRAQLYSHALNSFKTAIALDCYAPFVSLHLAQIYQQLGELKKANYYYHKAIKDNPENPQFYVSLAQLLLHQNEIQQAIEWLEQGIKHVGYLPILVIKYADLLISDNQLEKAQRILGECTNTENPHIVELQTRLTLLKDYESGVKRYKDSVRERVQKADKISWLAETTLLLSHASAEHDLLTRCYQHWKQLNVEVG